MPKNQLLFSALKSLTLSNETPKQLKQFEAFDAIIGADTDDAIRRAVIAHKSIFPAAEQAAIFENPTANESLDDFLATAGELQSGSYVCVLKDLKGLALQQRVLFGLEQAKNDSQKTAAYQELLKNISEATRRSEMTAALKKDRAPIIVGELKCDNLRNLLSKERCKAIRSAVVEVQTAPIEKKIRGLFDEISVLDKLATEALSRIQVTSPPVDPDPSDNAVLTVQDDFDKMQKRLKALTDYRDQASQKEVLNYIENQQKRHEIEAQIASIQARVTFIETEIQNKGALLVEVVTRKAAVVAQELTTLPDPRSLPKTRAARNKAKTAFEVLEKAVKLIRVPLDQVVIDNKNAAEKHLRTLDLFVHRDMAEENRAAIDEVHASYQTVQSIEDSEKRDDRRGVLLDKAEQFLDELGEQRKQATALSDWLQDAQFVAVVNDIDKAYQDSEQLIQTMRGQVRANLRMQKNTDEQMFSSLGHACSVSVVKKDAPLDQSPTSSVPPPAPALATAGQNHVLPSYQGVRLRGEQVIRSIERFAKGPQQTQAPTGILEQDKSGRVSNVTKSDEFSKMSQQQKSILAMRQAKMLIDNYDPEKGPVFVSGTDAAFAQMICGALLAQKGSLSMEIIATVQGVPSPQKGSWIKPQSSLDDAYIQQCGLDASIVQIVLNSPGPKHYTEATQRKRKELESLREALFNKDEKRAEADSQELKVGEEEHLDDQHRIVKNNQGTP
jgi:hypothetical protein